MEDRISEWIESEESPRDFYELLGVRQFDPRRENLLKAIKDATRVVQLYQNHQEKEVVRRAHEYQGMLGSAAETFSDDDLWHDYDETLVEQLRCHYATGAGNNSATWRPEYLRRWLTAVRDVHPERIDELIRKLIPSTKESTAKRDVELIEPEEPPTPRQPKSPVRQPKAPARRPAPREKEEPSPTAPDRSSKKPAPSSRSAPTSGESPFRGPGATRPVRPAAPGESGSGFPRPASRAPGTGRQPPLAKASSSAVGGPARAAGTSGRKGPANSSLFWFVGSAIATTLFLAVICVAIVIVVVRKRSSQEPPPQPDTAIEAESVVEGFDNPPAEDTLLDSPVPEFDPEFDPEAVSEDDPF